MNVLHGCECIRERHLFSFALINLFIVSFARWFFSFILYEMHEGFFFWFIYTPLFTLLATIRIRMDGGNSPLHLRLIYRKSSW